MVAEPRNVAHVVGKDVGVAEAFASGFRRLLYHSISSWLGVRFGTANARVLVVMYQNLFNARRSRGRVCCVPSTALRCAGHAPRVHVDGSDADDVDRVHASHIPAIYVKL